MRKWFGRVAVVLWIAGAGLTTASAQTSLGLDDAVKLALDRNLSLQRAALDLGAKKRVSDNAWGVLVPSTSFSAGYARPNQGFTLLGAKTDPVWDYSQSVGVSLTLPASLFSNLAQVSLNYQAGQLSYALARRSLEKNVRLVYGSLLLEEENLRLARENLARKQTSYNDTQAKYKAGLASDLDVLSAQVGLETLKPGLQRLQTTYDNDLGQFKVLLGLPTADPLTLSGTLDTNIENSLDLSAVSQGSAQSPDVRQAELSVRASELNLDATRLSSWLPTASMSWNTVPALALTSGAQWADTSGALSLRLSYSLDSFFWWTTSSENVSNAQDQVTSTQSQLSETKTNSALKRDNDVRLIHQAVESLATQTLNVTLAQKTYDLSLDAYHRGTKDLLTLQNSEGDLNQARYDLLSQRYALLSAVLDLEYELDLPFGTLWGGKQQ